jgi:hypothetical protein
MNALTQTFAIAFGSVVAAAAIGIGLADRTAQPEGPVVQLERVVVVGQRTPPVQVMAKLPRVVIEHRRTDAPVTVAEASAPRTL